MSATTVSVNLGERNYPIAVNHDHLAGLAAFVQERARCQVALIVTDHNVAEHAKKVAATLHIRTEIAEIPPGETQKALSTVARLYDQLVDLQADRQTLVIPVGGGVIGDLAGFVAATYARGLPMLMVPTTLLAMVDSSVGGKVGVNHPKAKNLIGAFHQPVGVWIDTACLQTLPDREYRSGLAEVVKYGVILDPGLFAFLEDNTAAIRNREHAVLGHIIARCCRLKADVVEQDERETTGLRAILNYGHTFAHAFETAAGYGTWLHGEAVAAGMVCAAQLAVQKGLIEPELAERQAELLQRFGLPTKPDPWPISVLLSAMTKDKKAVSGKMRFILPRRLGQVALFDDLAESEVRNVLDEAMQ